MNILIDVFKVLIKKSGTVNSFQELLSWLLEGIRGNENRVKEGRMMN